MVLVWGSVEGEGIVLVNGGVLGSVGRGVVLG